MRKGFIAAALVISLFLAVGAHATDVLYYCDYNLGTNPFPTAIANLGLSSYATSSISDFNTQMAGGGYKTAVLLVQNYSQSASDFPYVSSFMAAGAKMIFTDWYGIYGGNMASTFFGVTWSGNTNNALGNSVTVTAPFLSVGITNPISIYNPGWGIYATGIASGGTAGAYFANGDVAIAYGQNWIVNGMLKDTFVNQSQGVQLAMNELSGSPVPLPASLLFFAPGLAGLAAIRRRFKK
jgi:hypothetical protein